MSTYGTMTNRIIDELTNEDLTEDQVHYAIQDAIKVYERRPWWFNQRVMNFYTIVGQERYVSTTPSDFENIVQIDSMLCHTASTNDDSVMRGVDYSVIEDMQDGSITGRPTLHTRYANKIRFYPIPDAIWTINMSYIYKFDVLAQGSDTNTWMTDCEELIRQSAKRRLALDVLHANDIAERCASQERDAFGSLMAENRRRRPQKVLRFPDMPMTGGGFNINRGY